MAIRHSRFYTIRSACTPETVTEGWYQTSSGLIRMILCMHRYSSVGSGETWRVVYFYWFGTVGKVIIGVQRLHVSFDPTRIFVHGTPTNTLWGRFVIRKLRPVIILSCMHVCEVWRECLPNLFRSVSEHKNTGWPTYQNFHLASSWHLLHQLKRWL